MDGFIFVFSIILVFIIGYFVGRLVALMQWHRSITEAQEAIRKMADETVREAERLEREGSLKP